ncbi:MAG: beta-propeller domain-containing protein [Candidatus Pacebacteria bacterium]|nr:beta-propeller domain-containing protein [Candidatus Paceibacterota bacterium]
MESDSFTQGEFKGEPKSGGGEKAHHKILFLIAFFVIFISAILVLSKKVGWLNGLSSIFNPSATEEEGGTVKKFASYDEMLSFMEGNEIEIAGRDGSLMNTSVFKNSATSSSDNWELSQSPSSVPNSWGYESAPSSASSDYSSTNVQVEGVDEGDIVKTDGDYIYTVSGNKLLIFDAVPAGEAKILSRTAINYNPSGIYMSGDKLAVYGNNSNLDDYEEYDKIVPERRSSYATLSIYDVSDKSNPTLEKEYAFEGSYNNSRMIGDFIYFVSATTPVYIYYDNNQPVPYVLEDGRVADIPNKPSVYYFNSNYSSQNFTSITAVDIKNINEDVRSETYMLDGNQNQIFVSENNFYITFSKYVTEEELMVEAARELIVPRLSEQEQQRVSEIDSVKSYILNSSEKSEKISAIFEKYYASLSSDDKDALSEELDKKIEDKYERFSREMQKTVVHKIAISGGDLKYDTKGEVSGRVINQFAMDEDEDGYFRIATIVDRSWTRYSSSELSYNNVYVLDENMKQVGAVEDIAEGETIYSVRFMQDRAYMVTFKTTDPLFVISLSDPKNPKILGELKVPGYSTYLHPYSETKLIGLGMETDSRGWVSGGVKLSLFDVSDVENPKEIDTYGLGEYGSDSIALEEHRAFLLSKEKNLLVIPAVVKEKSRGDDGLYYSSYNTKVTSAGFAVFTVKDEGFELKGVIDHRTESEKSSFSYYYGDGDKRSLYIGDNLYSISDNFFKVNKLSDLTEEKSIDMDGYVVKNNWSWE